MANTGVNMSGSFNSFMAVRMESKRLTERMDAIKAAVRELRDKIELMDDETKDSCEAILKELEKTIERVDERLRMLTTVLQKTVERADEIQKKSQSSLGTTKDDMSSLGRK